jgi:hypothetical protein
MPIPRLIPEFAPRSGVMITWPAVKESISGVAVASLAREASCWHRQALIVMLYW